mgnify:CR=1 FL=1
MFGAESICVFLAEDDEGQTASLHQLQSSRARMSKRSKREPTWARLRQKANKLQQQALQLINRRFPEQIAGGASTSSSASGAASSMSLRIFRFSAPDKCASCSPVLLRLQPLLLRLHRSRQRTRRPSHSGLRSLGALHRSSMPTTGQRHSSARRSAEQRQTVPRWPAVTVVTDQRLAGSLAPLQIACREKLADRAWATLFGVFLH